MKQKFRCKNYRCDWKGYEEDILVGISPFDGEEITGCPKCKDINTIVSVCDEKGCWDFVSCGMSTKTGYRSTCHKHVPKD